MSHEAGPPVTISELLADALHYHRGGHLKEAEWLYRQVLACDAGHADGLHLLGLVAYQTGRADLAAELIGQAIAISAGVAVYHANLGNVLWQQGRLDEAAACYRRALALKPDDPDALYNLANAHRVQGRLDEATALYREALALSPDWPEGHINLGVAIKALGCLEEAAACYRKAIALDPDSPDAHYNLGNTLLEQERLEEAADCYRQAIACRPAYPEALTNLGTTVKALGRLDEAIDCYRRALRQQPCIAEAHHSLGMALLARGDLADGWVEYEWRWQTPQMMQGRRHYPQPQWRGEAAGGQVLLIHAEQGFGDTLQFCRYAPLAAAQGLRVLVQAPRPLIRLLRGLPCIDRVVADDEALPAFDLHCPMLSLPLALGTTVDTIPGTTPYLRADPTQVARWRARLPASDGGRAPRIGLVWAGRSRDSRSLATVDRRRSLPPGRLAPLFNVPGLRFYSLQKDDAAAPHDFPLVDFMHEMEDFADTAALIANLDLVISVDTAVAHLAAAMGKPVWLLNRFDSCWRWFTGRRDSPWYPTLALYRQPRAGDWESVLADVVRDLSGFRWRIDS
jgi:tetratricopeptide (TPR) repeat protein